MLRSFYRAAQKEKKRMEILWGFSCWLSIAGVTLTHVVMPIRVPSWYLRESNKTNWHVVRDSDLKKNLLNASYCWNFGNVSENDDDHGGELGVKIQKANLEPYPKFWDMYPIIFILLPPPTHKEKIFLRRGKHPKADSKLNFLGQRLVTYQDTVVPI